MNNYIEHFKRECHLAGWCDESGKFDCEMQERICNGVIELLEVFGSEGHSGSSAPYAIKLFSRAAKFMPITPLTGERHEWSEVGDGMWQNKRLSSVFKDADGRTYDIDGRVFWEWLADSEGDPIKSYFTSSGSAKDITFPYVQPEEPEYVFRPNDEFPNEELATPEE